VRGISKKDTRWSRQSCDGVAISKNGAIEVLITRIGRLCKAPSLKTERRDRSTSSWNVVDCTGVQDAIQTYRVPVDSSHYNKRRLPRWLSSTKGPNTDQPPSTPFRWWCCPFRHSSVYLLEPCRCNLQNVYVWARYQPRKRPGEPTYLPT
jgi:hypothetical protein